MVNPLYKGLMERFYKGALSVNAETRPTAVLAKILTDGFKSVNGDEVKDRATLSAQLEGFWTLIPDLKWQPVDKVVEGDRCVVRSVATGTPRGKFMGLMLDGSRSFKIDTIDIHTVENDRIVEVHHLEDWATAIRQLKG